MPNKKQHHPLARRLALLCTVFIVAYSACARSSFDFDERHIPLSYVTRSTSSSYANALTNSSATTWLGANGRIEMSVTLQATGVQVIFAQGSNVGNNTWELLTLNNNQWRLGYKGQYTSVANPAPAANTKYDIVCERKDGKLYLTINGVECINGKSVGELGRSEGLTFFHRKSGDNWNANPSTMKFHYARIYNDGELDAEFIPCAINVFGCGLVDTTGGTPDDVALGGDCDWNERGAKMHEKFCNAGVDEGGVEVDWVEPAGKVDSVQTDFVPDPTDIIKMKLMLTDANSHQTIFSSGGAGASGLPAKAMALLCLAAGTWRADFADGSGASGGSWTTNVDYEVEYSRAEGVKVNGAACCTVSGSTSFVPTYGITFFTRMYWSGDLGNALQPLNCPAKYKFYWAKVYASDGITLKADFVPYVDGNGFAGIKEKLSGKVFLPLFGRLNASNGAHPTAVYASPDAYADDTNAGTVRSPFKTVGTAVGKTATAGTVYLKEGTYRFSSSIALEGNDTAHAVIGVSEDPSRVVISANGAFRAFVSRNQSNAVFKNLTISNCVVGASGGAIYAQNAQIENCIFVSNSVSTTSGISGGGAIYADGCTVKRCVFRGNRSLGSTSLGSGALLLGNSLVENCLFEGNVADDGTSANGRCCTVYIGSDSTATIRNCTFVKNRAQTVAEDSTAGIRCDSAAASIVNTAFCGNEHNLGGSLKHSVVRLGHGTVSMFVNCAADYTITNGCRKIDDGGSAFADWTNGDYSPHGKSRLINRGIAYFGRGVLPEQYGIDLWGNPRYVGASIDIGAYEWQGDDPQFGTTIIIK